MATKQCKQCMAVLPTEQFRQYYQYGADGIRTNARYKYCLKCEKTNSRYKYIKRKEIEPTEQLQIEELYRQQALKGGAYPGMNKTVAFNEHLQSQLQELQSVPDDNLLRPIEDWLTIPLESFNAEYLYNEFLEQLEARYEDTEHDHLLTPIQKRFRAYLDSTRK